MIEPNVTISAEVLQRLYNVYRAWWYETGCYDAGAILTSDGVPIAGISTLITSEDYDTLEEACTAVEPFESLIQGILEQAAILRAFEGGEKRVTTPLDRVDPPDEFPKLNDEPLGNYDQQDL